MDVSKKFSIFILLSNTVLYFNLCGAWSVSHIGYNNNIFDIHFSYLIFKFNYLSFGTLLSFVMLYKSVIWQFTIIVSFFQISAIFIFL